MGRPTKYTEELAAKILAQIATTNLGLRAICRQNKTFPAPKTIYLWLLQKPDFCKRYARAKDDQLQVLEDEILEIADTPQMGEIVTEKPVIFEGKVVKSGRKPAVQREIKQADMIEHRKLRIDARKWLMGKLKPKKYGDKVALTDPSGASPAVIKWTIERIGPAVKPDEIAK